MAKSLRNCQAPFSSSMSDMRPRVSAEWLGSRVRIERKKLPARHGQTIEGELPILTRTPEFSRPRQCSAVTSMCADRSRMTALVCNDRFANRPPRRSTRSQQAMGVTLRPMSIPALGEAAATDRGLLFLDANSCHYRRPLRILCSPPASRINECEQHHSHNWLKCRGSVVVLRCTQWLLTHC